MYSLLPAKIYTPNIPSVKENLVEVTTICVILKINENDCFPQEASASRQDVPHSLAKDSGDLSSLF